MLLPFCRSCNYCSRWSGIVLISNLPLVLNWCVHCGWNTSRRLRTVSGSGTRWRWWLTSWVQYICEIDYFLRSYYLSFVVLHTTHNAKIRHLKTWFVLRVLSLNLKFRWRRFTMIHSKCATFQSLLFFRSYQ